jgi:hypothetical protein
MRFFLLNALELSFVTIAIVLSVLIGHASWLDFWCRAVAVLLGGFLAFSLLTDVLGNVPRTVSSGMLQNELLTRYITNIGVSITLRAFAVYLFYKVIFD